MSHECSFCHRRSRRAAVCEIVPSGGNPRFSNGTPMGRPFHARYSENADSGRRFVTAESQSMSVGQKPTSPVAMQSGARVRRVVGTNAALPCGTDSTNSSKNDNDKTPTSQMRETMSSGTDAEYSYLGVGGSVADFSLGEPEAGR